MRLTSVVKELDFEIIQGDINQVITNISYDSKNIQKDNVFVAISGFSQDGHDAIHEAIDNGATVIILEKEIQVNKQITILKVANSRNALARIAANFHLNPTDHLNTIGITGTNGKTSITFFLKTILEEANKSVGAIGTLGTIINGDYISNKNTTPESLNLQQFFADMNQAGTDFCLMEVSSHALQLDRVAFTKFNTGIFTNLSPDHLELHKSMDAYFHAKAMLFQMTEDLNIINADDLYGQKLIEQLKNQTVKTTTYGIYEEADFYATNIHYNFNETIFTLHTPKETAEITIHLPGEIYVSNSLAAIAAAYSNGISLDVIKAGLDKVKNIAGRLEVIYEKNDFKVIIDFAHTEDALLKTIQLLKPYVKGKIIVVFGVYADMSVNGTKKRRGMGRVAAENANFSIVTLDNPKYHDIDQIMAETTDAIQQSNGKYIEIRDREQAIRYAIKISEDHDFILLAGKGHENTQIIGEKEINFSEKDIVLDAVQLKVFN